MATAADTIELLLEQLSGLHNRLRARKMFGEYCLYIDDKPTAFICDDQLFLKITPISRQFLDESHDAPAYPGSKPYICIPPDMWDDREWLAEVIEATADSLPVPNKR